MLRSIVSTRKYTDLSLSLISAFIPACVHPDLFCMHACLRTCEHEELTWGSCMAGQMISPLLNLTHLTITWQWYVTLARTYGTRDHARKRKRNLLSIRSHVRISAAIAVVIILYVFSVTNDIGLELFRAVVHAERMYLRRKEERANRNSNGQTKPKYPFIISNVILLPYLGTIELQKVNTFKG